jgi:hypothetical protein
MELWICLCLDFPGSTTILDDFLKVSKKELLPNNQTSVRNRKYLKNGKSSYSKRLSSSINYYGFLHRTNPHQHLFVLIYYKPIV